jgi:hypothetical protein
MAGLPSSTAMVSVRPLLSCEPLGSSLGSVKGLELLAALKPQLVALSML